MTTDAGNLSEARFYKQRPGNPVRCTLCPHVRRIADGTHGACGVHMNRRRGLFTLVYDRVVSRNVDPVEQKLLFHFMPGARAYSTGTVGCNLRCRFRQNWEISQWPRKHVLAKTEWAEDAKTSETICPLLRRIQSQIPSERVTPRQIVDAAFDSGTPAVAYTYTEPTIFYELAYDFRYHELGVWVEANTLVISRVNDSEGELRRIAEFICSVGRGAESPRMRPNASCAWTPSRPIRRVARAGHHGIRTAAQNTRCGRRA